MGRPIISTIGWPARWWPVTLEQDVLAAHARGDGAALASLYSQAADAAETVDAAAFFLTHAFVYALEFGLPSAADLNARLVAMDRALPLEFEKENAHAH